MSIIEFPAIGRCVLCGSEVDLQDFCFGCHAFICQGCTEKDIYGHHKPRDHSVVAENFH